MTNLIPRREVEEIVACHALEATLVDVFVEGYSDECILRWYCVQRGLKNVQVYGIETVDISSSMALFGNRQRVIELAATLGGRVTPGKVSCVCDLDFEQWVPSAKISLGTLVFTDFACMEGYFIEQSLLEKFLIMVVGAGDLAPTFLQDLGPLIMECFLIRLAHAVLGWDLCWISPERCCEVKNGLPSLDRSEFIKRLLQKNGHIKDLECLERKIGELRPTLGSDPRHSIHGHDFMDLLAWFLKKRASVSHSSDVLYRMLMGCVREEGLVPFSLFSTLEDRAKQFARCPSGVTATHSGLMPQPKRSSPGRVDT